MPKFIGTPCIVTGLTQLNSQRQLVTIKHRVFGNTLGLKCIFYIYTDF